MAMAEASVLRTDVLRHVDAVLAASSVADTVHLLHLCLERARTEQQNADERAKAEAAAAKRARDAEEKAAKEAAKEARAAAKEAEKQAVKEATAAATSEKKMKTDMDKAAAAAAAASVSAARKAAEAERRAEEVRQQAERATRTAEEANKKREEVAEQRRRREEVESQRRAEAATADAQRRVEAEAAAKIAQEEAEARRLAQEKKAAANEVAMERAAAEKWRATEKAAEEKARAMEKAAEEKARAKAEAAAVKEAAKKEAAEMAERVAAGKRAAKELAKESAKKEAAEAAEAAERIAAVKKAAKEAAKIAAKKEVNVNASSSSGASHSRMEMERLPSTATTINRARLERAQSRADAFGQSARERADADGDEHAVLSISHQTASKALKSDGGASANGNDDDEATTGKYEDPMLPNWLRPYRECEGEGAESGSRAADFVEMPTDVGSTGDCLSCDVDGDTLVSIGADGDVSTVSVYSARRGEVIRSLRGHTDKVCCVAVSGELVVSAGTDKSIRLWSLSTGESTGIVSGCTERVYGLSVHGDLILTGEAEGGGVGVARLWLLDATRTRASALSVLKEHSGHVWSVAFADEQHGVSASHDTTVKIWPLDGNTSSLATLAHPDWVCSVSAVGDVVATGCGDGRVRIWSRSSAQLVRTLDHNAGRYFSEGLNTRVRVGTRSPVFSVRIVPGGVLSGGQDQHIRIWSMNGECVASLLHGANVRGLSGASTAAGSGFVASVGGNRGDGNIKKLIVWRPPASKGAPAAVVTASAAPVPVRKGWGTRRSKSSD